MNNLLNTKTMKEIQEDREYCKSLEVVKSIPIDQIEVAINNVRRANIGMYISCKSDLILHEKTVVELAEDFEKFSEEQILDRLMIYDKYGF